MGVKRGLSHCYKSKGQRVFENRLRGKIFRPEREEVKGEWRRKYNKELHDLYCSTNNIRLIKSRRRLTGNMTCRR
jgi:hypothetical protein